MLNTYFMPLFVTKVRKVGNLEPNNPFPVSVVGSFVPETNVGVGVNEEVPTNVDQQKKRHDLVSLRKSMLPSTTISYCRFEFG